MKSAWSDLGEARRANGMRPAVGGHWGLKCEAPILRMGRMLFRGRDGLGGRRGAEEMGR